MIRSMTGYGRAHTEGENFTLTTEVRSVNNRFLKMSVRLPELWQALAPKVEGLIKEQLTRGSVQVRLHKRGTVGGTGDFLVSRKAVEEYRRQLAEIDGGEKVTIAQILQLPGAVGEADESTDELEDDWKVLKGLISEALGQLGDMRTREGAHLGEVLLAGVENVRELTGELEKGIPSVVEDYRNRLRERVEELLRDSKIKVSDGDLARELAVYAERSDIREEIDRMHSHLKQFAEMMESDDPVGRRLEFIVQEMFREANTMGSKVGDVGLSQLVLDVKCEVDRLKEQVMNVE